MHPTNDDSRLTAYALGELSAEEALLVEAAAAADPALREDVDDIHTTAELLRAEFAVETVASLGDEQRAAILERAGEPTASAGHQELGDPRPRFVWERLLIAASLLMAIALWTALPQQMSETDSPDTYHVTYESVDPDPSTPPAASTAATPSLRSRRTDEAQSQSASLPDAAMGLEVEVEPPTVALENYEAALKKREDLGRDLQADAGTSILTVSGLGSPHVALGHTQSMQVDGDAAVIGTHFFGFDDRRTASTWFAEGSLYSAYMGPIQHYERVYGKPFARVADEPLSTFSLDVDTASYANIRRMLASGHMPPQGSVRLEEMVNSFDYGWPSPEGDAPLAVDLEVTACPWAPGHQLVRVGVRAKQVERDNRPPANLVFLIDISGSMKPMNRLPLLKQSMKLLLGELLPTDRVGIVVFSGSASVALPSTSVSERETILTALGGLSAEGSTNGASGIEMAYECATKAGDDPVFAEGGIHRVILATDGDFNAGMTDRGDLVELIETQAKSGVFLSILGFGMGNLKDATMEDLSNRGNGNYAYIDSLEEAERALVYEVMGTLMTVAKDVKVQVEMNPAEVEGYRLVGYANRGLAATAFNDDAKDAGDVGAGHTITAFYEITPARPAGSASVDGLRYQKQPVLSEEAHVGEILTLKLRYKDPGSDESKLLTVTAKTEQATKYSASSSDTRFAAAVAAFGMLLDGSPHSGNATYDQILELAGAALGEDEHGQRKEFLDLVERAKAITGAR